MAQDTDFLDWLTGQLDALERRDPKVLDWDQLAEEVEGLLARYRQEVGHWGEKIMRVLMRNDFRYGDWNRLRHCSRMLESALEDSPGLRLDERQELIDAYASAKNKCALDGVDISGWPDESPWLTVRELIEATKVRCDEFAVRERRGDFM
jgi:hypothetical protein